MKNTGLFHWDPYEKYMLVKFGIDRAVETLSASKRGIGAGECGREHSQQATEPRREAPIGSQWGYLT